MVVKDIFYDPKFIEDLQRLDFQTQERAYKTEQLFRSNPLHPSLRLHALKGKLLGSWSISVNLNVRIIFNRLSDGNIAFYSIGTHDIYKHL